MTKTMTKTVFYVTFYGNGDDIFTPDKQFENVDELIEFIRWAFANLCNPYEYYAVVDTVDVETGEVLYIGEMNMYVFNVGAMLVYNQTYESSDVDIENILEQ
jgi:hypothetical protein